MLRHIRQLFTISMLNSPQFRQFLSDEIAYLKLFLPVWLYMFSTYTLGTTGVTFFTGKMDDLHLAGITLGMNAQLRMVFCFMIGFTSVFDIYGPQLIGKTQQKELGRLMVKILILGFGAFLLWIPLIVGSVLLMRRFPLITQNEQLDSHKIRQIAEDFMFMYLGIFFLDFVVEIFLKYFANLRFMLPVYCVPVLQAIIQVTLSYIFVCELEMKGEGIVLAALFSRMLSIMIIISIMFWKRVEWNFEKINTKDIFENWKTILSIGSAAGFQMMLTYLNDSVATYLCQRGGRVTMEVYGIIHRWAGISFPAAFAISYTSAITVGNALGEKDISKIQYNIVLSVLNAIISIIVFLPVLFFSYDWFTSIFTSDSDVIGYARNTVYMVALFTTFDSFQELLGRGTLIVFGKVKFVSIVVTASTFLVGLPILFYTTFATELYVYGLFLGLIAQMSVRVVSFCIALTKLDLIEEVKLCSERLEEETNYRKENDPLAESFEES